MTDLQPLLRGVARRLRLVWAVATAELMAPVVALAALALVLVGWLQPWGWPEPTAVALVAIAIVAVLVGALVVRITPLMAARAADAGLDTRDAFTAALQFGDHDRFGGDIVARAHRFAVEGSAAEAVPVRPRRRPWFVAALVGVGAMVLAVVGNPQDDTRAEQQADAEAIEAEADELDDTAEALLALPDPSDAERALAADLAALAAELRGMDDLDAAIELIRDAEQSVSRDPSALLSTKAAVQGLNRSLENQPLPGVTGSAEQQLAQLAAALDGLSEEEIDDLADRLDALAATQEAGNDEAADALSAAADAMRSGDTAGAQAALGEASAAQATGEGAVREGESSQAAGQSLNASADALEGRRDGEGQGEGQGQGSGEGQGQGSGEGQGSGDGQGSGEGQGEGQGQGSGGGQGQGGGSPSGEVGGSSGGTGEGQGGVGDPNGRGDSSEVGGELDVPTFFQPGGESEELFADAVDNGGDSETTGLGEGATNYGGAQVPVADVLPDFASRAVEAVDDSSVAPSTRALVRRYFDSLAGLASPEE